MYYGVGAIILVFVAYVVWASFLNTAPSCFDGKQNGTELGIDCGGVCSLLCQDTVRQPTALWARPFQTGGTTYTAAAYIQNNNVGAGAKHAAYSFQLFDQSNNLVKEVDGYADLPPTTIVPIVVPNINVGNRTVVRAQFAFAAPPAWNRVPDKDLPKLSVSQQNLSADGSRLSATIRNQTLNDAKNVTVAAVLFDSQGIARAASKSLLSKVAAQSSEQVVFTWPQGMPDIVRAEITVLPSF